MRGRRGACVGRYDCPNPNMIVPDTLDKGSPCDRCGGLGTCLEAVFDKRTKEYRSQRVNCKGCWGRGKITTHQRNAEIVEFRKP